MKENNVLLALSLCFDELAFEVLSELSEYCSTSHPEGTSETFLDVLKKDLVQISLVNIIM